MTGNSRRYAPLQLVTARIQTKYCIPPQEHVKWCWLIHEMQMLVKFLGCDPQGTGADIEDTNVLNINFLLNVDMHLHNVYCT